MERIASTLAVALGMLAVAACSAKGAPAANSPGSPRPGSTAGPIGPSASTPSAKQSPAAVEKAPPGDIPDNIAYVAYTNTAGRYTFMHPEGWASVVQGPAVTFTDKLNGISATSRAANAAPTVASAKTELVALQATQPAFEFRSMKPVALPAGTGVLIVFRRNSTPDQVTGKVFRDEVQRYEIYRGGREVILDLFGAVGSDNVDPYRKISQSLRIS